MYEEQIEWYRKREVEIIKRMDLDEIDLITERLSVFGVDVSRRREEAKRNYPRIPKLDIEKCYKIKQREDEEGEDEGEYEEEEIEIEEDIKSSQKKFFQDGSALVSDASAERREELKRRKEQVIALLYENESNGSEVPASSFEN